MALSLELTILVMQTFAYVLFEEGSGDLYTHRFSLRSSGVRFFVQPRLSETVFLLLRSRHCYDRAGDRNDYCDKHVRVSYFGVDALSVRCTMNERQLMADS